MFIILNHKHIIECKSIDSVSLTGRFSFSTINIDLNKADFSFGIITSIYLSRYETLYTSTFNDTITYKTNEVVLQITSYCDPKIDKEYLVHFRERRFNKLFPD